jgi:hypothetical protein
MKKILTILAIIIVFCVFQFISAQSDYSWHTKYLDQKGKNWVVFAQFDNAVNPLFIYSLFKPPITRLGIIDKNTLKKVSDNIYFVNSLWVDKDPGLGEPIKEEPFSYFLDCNAFNNGNIKNNFDSPPDENFDLNTIQWTPEETIKKYPEGIETNRKECITIKSFLDKR